MTQQSRRPNLDADQIAAWADRQREVNGEWPSVTSGPVVEVPDEQWQAIDSALRKGDRGLPGGSSLAQLLGDKRGVPSRATLPPLTLDQIKEWALTHYSRTGKWPGADSGPIPEASGETWRGVYQALRSGYRGLPAGGSLKRLVEELRDSR